MLGIPFVPCEHGLFALDLWLKCFQFALSVQDLTEREDWESSHALEAKRTRMEVLQFAQCPSEMGEWWDCPVMGAEEVRFGCPLSVQGSSANSFEEVRLSFLHSAYGCSPPVGCSSQFLLVLALSESLPCKIII